MKGTSLKYWSAFPAVVGGSALGVLLLIALRVEYYRAMEYQPNIAPQIAYYFLPVLLAAVLLVASPIEFTLRRLWYAPQSQVHAMLIGVGYSTLLLWWVFPGHWAIMLLVNPFSVRWAIGLNSRSRPTR